MDFLNNFLSRCANASDFALQQTWGTSTAGGESTLRLCPTSSSTWLCPRGCRTWRVKGKSATIWPMLTTAWDSTKILSGERCVATQVKAFLFCVLGEKPPDLKHFWRFLRYYEQDLALAKDLQDKLAQAKAYCNLGLAHKALGEYRRAEECQRYLLSLAQALDNTQAVFRAYGNLGDVFVCRGDPPGCYEAQLGLAQGLRDARLEAQVHGNMGITKMNMAVFEEAIGYFEQQLAMLQQLSGSEGMLDRGRAYGSLADCYDALGDYEEAIQYYEKYLTVAQSLNHVQDQEKAYRGLGNAHRLVSAGGRKTSKTCSFKNISKLSAFFSFLLFSLWVQVLGQSPAGTGVLREAVGGGPRAGRRGWGEGAGLRGAGHPAQPAGELRAGPVLSGAPAQHRSLSRGKVHTARLPIWQEIVFVKNVYRRQ
uniref:Uncharacterized protein n=1 Tax=Poecilia reticulata TaxID=8081 RepID=A0A3P9PRS5_POERE